MTMAVDLSVASGLSLSQCSLIGAGGAAAFKTAYQAFCVQASLVFDDNVPVDQPMGNWLVPMFAASNHLPAVGISPPLDELYQCAFYVSQMCLVAYNYATTAQKAALLIAWNAHIGT